jgi:hypothetical protein
MLLLQYRTVRVTYLGPGKFKKTELKCLKDRFKKLEFEEFTRSIQNLELNLQDRFKNLEFKSLQVAIKSGS